MAWMGATGAEQPTEVQSLLRSLDSLVISLAQQHVLAADLRGVPLQRHEVQVTCYPGNGARYVRHGAYVTVPYVTVPYVTVPYVTVPFP